MTGPHALTTVAQPMTTNSSSSHFRSSNGRQQVFGGESNGRLSLRDFMQSAMRPLCPGAYPDQGRPLQRIRCRRFYDGSPDLVDG